MPRIGLAALAALALTATAADAQTLRSVKDRGQLACGVSQGIPGFSAPDEKGQWSGFDVDFCRALAAAIFNDDRKVQFVPLSTNDRFASLARQEDRRAVAQLDMDDGARDRARLDLRRSQLLRRSGVHGAPGAQHRPSALELADKTVCVQSGTTTELNLADFFRDTG